MKRLNLVLALAAIAFVVSTSNVAGQERQGRGNFDPAEMQQRMMERYREQLEGYREQLEVKDDAEWKLIVGRVEKVMTAQREARSGAGAFGFGRGFGGPGGGRRGGDNADQAGDQNRRPRGFGGEPSPEAEALQKAIEAKAPAEEIKTKLAKYRESRKAKEAALEKSQEELRTVLNARQEATAVLMGLLK